MNEESLKVSMFNELVRSYRPSGGEPCLLQRIDCTETLDKISDMVNTAYAKLTDQIKRQPVSFEHTEVSTQKPPDNQEKGIKKQNPTDLKGVQK